MHKLFFIFLLLQLAAILHAQDSTVTSIPAPKPVNADDPSQFLTRIEVYNELQHYDKKSAFYINQTVFRTIVKIGKKFTTRLDLPYVHNSLNTPAGYKQSGIGDISFRLLGFKFFERPKSAFTTSLEISLNTAGSPILGTGKNILVPVVSYTKLLPRSKMLLSFVLQQTNSIGGDEARADISFTKLQFLTLKYFSRRTWIVIAPEWFIDYMNGGLSMNLRSRLAYAPTPRTNIWITPSAGIFGDFIGLYQWSVDVGVRYFLLRSMNFKKKT